MMQKADCLHIGNSAVGFGERERTAIFSVVLRRLFERENN